MLNIDDAVRKAIYDTTLQEGVPPTISELAAHVEIAESDARVSLARLASARVIVTQPGTGELLMVPPFSAVPTPFVVHSARHTSFANCVWDALGVPVMMRQRATVESACGCCGESMTIDAFPDQRPQGEGVVHFAVPARHWWDDIVFT